MFQARRSVSLKKVANGDILVFQRGRLEPSVLPWRQHSRCHLLSFVMYNYGAKFKEHCFNSSRDIRD